jgi:tRNA pseudouridine55 synthase
MDGVLLIDKPQGPTSHDVVARLRRTTGERAIGHTGTLDPQATGLLPLVLGRATRLASLLTAGPKEYRATIRLGVETTTDDAEGMPVGTPAATLPADADIDRALAGFRGSFEQIPPAHSAKKVAGRRAYELARRDEAVALAPVPVVVDRLERTSRAGGLVDLAIVASSGFYVRALARDLGRVLGCGAHLVALRRIRSGPFSVERALLLAEAERLGRDLGERLIPPADALPHLVAVELNEVGLRRALHGNPVGPDHLRGRWIPPATTADPVRLVAADGRLVALARSRGGALHPVIVLG